MGDRIAFIEGQCLSGFIWCLGFRFLAGHVPVVLILAAGLVAMDDWLNALARFDARTAQVAELRVFGGLNVDETAEVPNRICPLS